MEFTFVLDEKEAQLILNVLGKKPFVLVAGVINNIQTQAQKQLTQQMEEKPNEKV